MTPVELCNLALSHVGQPYIAQLEDESRVARVCATHWPQVWKRILSASPWSSALRRSSLARLAAAPLWGWDYQYALPDDCLRVHEVNGADDTRRFAIEGRKLMSNETAVEILYTAAIVDLDTLHPAVIDALAAALAADIAYPLTHDRALQLQLVRLAQEKLQWAVDEDGTELQNAEFQYGSGDYLQARL